MESASFSRLVHPLERLISGFDYDFDRASSHHPLLAFRRALPLLMESSRLSNLPLANASPRPSFDSFLRVLDETDVNHSVIPRVYLLYRLMGTAVLAFPFARMSLFMDTSLITPPLFLSPPTLLFNWVSPLVGGY